VSVPSAVWGRWSSHPQWLHTDTGEHRGPSPAAASWLAEWCLPGEKQALEA
jgi:hypothetical protein